MNEMYSCPMCRYITDSPTVWCPSCGQVVRWCCVLTDNTDESQNKAPQKRKDYITWDTYFMGVAMLAAQRSKDPSTQVGACIVSADNIIVGVGYNGMPRGCDDDMMPWTRDGSMIDTKYPYVCHAELNAILNTNSANLKDCTLYVTLYPCNECAKAIIQSGIKKVIYYDNKYADTDGVKAATKMFCMSGVTVEQYTSTGNITLPL